MLTANEARFLIDVAKRSVDEVMALCDALGFHAGSTHTGSLRKMGPETDYLSLSDLNEILGSDTDANNDERVMDMYEAELLKKFFAEDQSTIPAQGEREAEENLRRELSLHLHLAM
uniref:Uncharacterized protein n=1 Tax=Octactis speculum TaxID=3111310 RepID=A0A7S2G9Q9_9STRA|mmetsp:Transcript_41121/g.56038  ORF Transcript_41121/g.56038 Transcript_41121/m.56038 type:complete len:116 (+) Transcript_41121:3-350(+)